MRRCGTLLEDYALSFPFQVKLCIYLFIYFFALSRPGQRARTSACQRRASSCQRGSASSPGKVVEKFSSCLLLLLLLFCCLSGFYARLLVARTHALVVAHSRLLSLPPRAVIPPRRICFPLPLSAPTMCHCSGPGGNVDPGRGSLLQPERLCCVGLCGTFVWLPPPPLPE